MPDTQNTRRFTQGQRVKVISDFANVRRGTLATVDYPVGSDGAMVWIRTDRGGVVLVSNGDIEEVH